MRAQTPTLVLAAAFAAGLLGVPMAASAALPAAVYGASLTTLNESKAYAAAGVYTLGNLTTTVQGSPGVLLSGHAQGTDLNVFDGNGSLESSIAYSFAVAGAPAGVIVPMFVSFTLHTEATGGGTDDASARFGLNNGAFDVFNVLSESSDSLAHPNFSGTLGFNQVSDAVGRISLQIDVRALGGGTADAFADPFVFIDPDFLATHQGYSVIVSSGIGNSAPTTGGIPEPAAWALMVLGFGGLGAALRTRRGLRAA